MEWSAPRFQIDADGPIEVGVDGEAMRLDPPLVFESVPGVFTVRLPQSAIGLSPAARRMERSSIRELFVIAKGGR